MQKVIYRHLFGGIILLHNICFYLIVFFTPLNKNMKHAINNLKQQTNLEAYSNTKLVLITKSSWQADYPTSLTAHYRNFIQIILYLFCHMEIW